MSWLEDICVLAGRHMYPDKKTHVLARGHMLATRHMCPGWKTHVSWLEDICVMARRHMCMGLRRPIIIDAVPWRRGPVIIDADTPPAL